MKFTVNSKVLQGRLSTALKAVPAKPILSILSNFVITATGEDIIIRSSDTEVMLSVTAKASSVEEIGEVCVDAKFITNLIKNTADVPVTISTDGGKVIVTTPSGSYTTSALDASAFPTAEKFTGSATASFVLPAESFTKGLQSVAFACSTDSFRPQLMGVCIDCKGNVLRMYATDTRVLAKFTAKAEAPDCRFIIPMRIIQMLSSTEGDVKVVVREDSVDFQCENFHLRSQLLQGVFPDCERVFPTMSTTEVDISKAAIVGAIRRAGVCSDIGTPIMRLSFGSSQVEVATKDIQYGREARENIPCSCIGQPICIAFAYDKLSDVLGAIGGEDVHLSMSDPGRPGVFRSSSDTENELSVLLMPMNVQ